MLHQTVAGVVCTQRADAPVVRYAAGSYLTRLRIALSLGGPAAAAEAAYASTRHVLLIHTRP